ncbi:hypothetical protein CPB83DRAFT_891832 [Crepidotus variabilis]|uniref:Uncharacterized protein n=1 Tax=Crepidotus variabilis TaxID=179855 RepID=A0A9P6JS18_9AGAR|nr:hypothetical protein CPB83DRAFT_891832 [Crepidotus variabilis]
MSCFETLERPPSPTHTSLPETNASHTVANLPCSEDKDLSDIPHVTYLPEDVSKIRRLLENFLPGELADIIVDKAEIWPYVAKSRNAYSSSCTALEGSDGNAQWCYLVSPAVPTLTRNGESIATAVRKVKFYIKSYESSWGDQRQSKTGPTFKTWFEASVLKQDEPGLKPYADENEPHDWFTSLSSPRPKYLNNLLPVDPLPEGGQPTDPTPSPFDSEDKKRWTVANDTLLDGQWQEIVWTPGQEDNSKGFFDTLTVGDRIVMMTRALAPGWINTIFNVRMEVFYSLPASAFEI